jgi:hypothetical protein
MGLKPGSEWVLSLGLNPEGSEAPPRSLNPALACHLRDLNPAFACHLGSEYWPRV